jgi:hypothetical protein
MVSHRQRKKEAARAGLTEPELRLLELVDEILERLRWQSVLLHAQSFLLRERLQVADQELDRVLRAASQAVDKDATWRRWQEGVARLKGEILEQRRAIRREHEHLLPEEPAAGEASA